MGRYVPHRATAPHFRYRAILFTLQDMRDFKELKETPLIHAAYKNRLWLVKLLIAFGAKIDKANSLGQTPLTIAAHLGCAKVTEYLLSKGARFPGKNRNGESILHTSIKIGGDLETVKVLLKYGAKINDPDREGNTPLMIAVQKGCCQIVKYLCEKGADPNLQNAKGETAIIIAAANIHISEDHVIYIVNTIVAHGGNINIQDSRGRSAIFYAIEKNKVRVVKFFLSGEALFDRRVKQY